jgi:hypothetical protein
MSVYLRLVAFRAHPTLPRYGSDLIPGRRRYSQAQIVFALLIHISFVTYQNFVPSITSKLQGTVAQLLQVSAKKMKLFSRLRH